MKELTLLDTGYMTAAQNIALDDILLKLRNDDKIPDTLRLLQFRPNAVLVGFHQSIEQEVRIDFCQQKNIDINRRITGGGTIYLDEPQLGWELIASRWDPDIPKNIDELYAKVCEGAVRGLKHLGIDAEFRPRNDIEVEGRKISGTGGSFESNSFFFQGTLLTDFDVESMIRALRIPLEKLKPKELESAKERVTCLKWELEELPPTDAVKDAIIKGFSEVFDVNITRREMTQLERRLLEERTPDFEAEKWVYGVRRPVGSRQVLRSIYKVPGGLIRTTLVVDIPNKRIQAALITGDFFIFPNRVIYDMEAVLKDAPLEKAKLEKILAQFFNSREIEMPGIVPQDFINAIFKAVDKLEFLEIGIPIEHINNVFRVCQPEMSLKDCNVLLLPYCAKSTACGYRRERDCAVCGECSIGEAYQLAEERGMEPITIISFEDLIVNLNELKARGEKMFLGSCCEAFYEKHIEDFEDAGLPGILFDIDSTTCYDLGREQEAYLGDFENETEFRIELLKLILKNMG